MKVEKYRSIIKNKFKVFLNNRKEELIECGLLYCIAFWLAFFLFFLLSWPFYLIYLLNDCSKSLFSSVKSD